MHINRSWFFCFLERRRQPQKLSSNVSCASFKEKRKDAKNKLGLKKDGRINEKAICFNEGIKEKAKQERALHILRMREGKVETA